MLLGPVRGPGTESNPASRKFCCDVLFCFCIHYLRNSLSAVIRPDAEGGQIAGIRICFQIFTVKMILPGHKGPHDSLFLPQHHMLTADIFQIFCNSIRLFFCLGPVRLGCTVAVGKRRNEVLIAQLQQPPDFLFLFSVLYPVPYNDSALAAHPRKPAYECCGCTHAIFYTGGIEPFFSGMCSPAPAETDTDGRNMPRQWDITVCRCLRAYRLFPVGCLQRFLRTPRHTCHLDRIGFSCARPLSDELTGILYLLTLACCYGLLQICFAGFQTPVILRTEFKQHGGILRNRINRGSSLYFSHIVCCMRCCIRLKTVKLSDQTRKLCNGIFSSEIQERMTALCFCRNPIPDRPDADGIHFIPIQVKGCHSTQIFFIMVDKRANSAQIAKPFFSQIRCKNQTAWKLRLCLMNVFCRHQKHHDIHGIVCDAGTTPDHSVFFNLQRLLQRKHSVQMRRIQNLLFLFRPILPDYISKLIRMN